MAACARGTGVQKFKFQNFKSSKFDNSGFALQRCHEKNCVRPLQNLNVDTRLLATAFSTCRTNGGLCVTLTRAQQGRMLCLQPKAGSRHADDSRAGRSKQVSSAPELVPCTQTPATHMPHCRSGVQRQPHAARAGLAPQQLHESAAPQRTRLPHSLLLHPSQILSPTHETLNTALTPPARRCGWRRCRSGRRSGKRRRRRPSPPAPHPRRQTR